MQRKLFYLLVFIFLFSFITKTFSSGQKTKRMWLTKSLQIQNTHDGSQNELNSFVPSTTDNLYGSNMQNQNNSAVSLTLLKTKHEKIKHFYFHYNLSLKRKDEISFDLLKPQEEKNSSVSSNLLNKLLETSNVFRFIFPYLSLFELELNFKCISKTFYHLYEKILQEEKTFLQSCLKNEKLFLENRNYTKQYFDFFEKRFWNHPKRIEYANVDSFFENLILLPKSIRQIICFKFDNIEYKYILFKDGHLSFLKQNIEGKFGYIFVKKHFENFNYPFRELQPCQSLASLQEHCRFLDMYELCEEKIYIHILKNDNFNQSIRHVKNHQKIFVTRHVFEYKILLKNSTGFLEHCGTAVNLWKFEKQNNGIYKMSFIPAFKQNVKEIKSKDFEHYAQDVLFIFKNTLV